MPQTIRGDQTLHHPSALAIRDVSLISANPTATLSSVDFQAVPARDHAGVVIFPPLLFALCAVLGGGLHFAWPVRLLPPLPARIAGALLVGAAGALALWAERTMSHAGTNVRPDRPTLAIVTSGPYRFTRNPMYIALCAVHLGIALLIDGLVPLLFVVPLALTLHFGVVRREERYLGAKFGAPYLAYRQQVRRWL